jgi:predicted glycosyltransferase
VARSPAKENSISLESPGSSNVEGKAAESSMPLPINRESLTSETPTPMPMTSFESHAGERTMPPLPAPLKIWIDLDNSPHVPLFLPIIEELEKKGYQVLLTARDSYQVCELLRLHGLACHVVGRHYGKKWILKVLGTFFRAIQLLPLAITEKPCLVVSHGSRAQIIVASLLGIPRVLMFDYEFSNATSFLSPDWVFVPDMIPAERVRQKPDHVLRYQGLKEDVYVPRFKPDANFRKALGVREDELIVTVRPPATEAHYHNSEGEEFLTETVEYLLDHPGARVVMLPRNENQATDIRSRWTRAIEQGRILIPERAVDGLNLIWNSDLVISGGGTMNREAAALGVPVFSIFRGHMGAVDQYLAKTGRLVLIEKVEDIRTKIALKPRKSALWGAANGSAVLDSIVDAIGSIAEHKCLPAHR